MNIHIPEWVLLLPAIYLGLGVLMYVPLLRKARIMLGTVYYSWSEMFFPRPQETWLVRIALGTYQFCWVVVAWPWAMKEVS